MPKRRESIYKTVYTGISIIFFLFFAHNMFENVTMDVLHLHKEVTISLFGWQYTHYVHDVFPAFHTSSPEFQMDIQVYFFRLSQKLIVFALFLILVRCLQVMNLLLKEIPGRGCRNLIAITWCFVGLSAYEVLDFIVHAGQSDWRPQAVVFFMVLTGFALHVKDEKNADYKDR